MSGGRLNFWTVGADPSAQKAAPVICVEHRPEFGSLEGISDNWRKSRLSGKPGQSEGWFAGATGSPPIAVWNPRFRLVAAEADRYSPDKEQDVTTLLAREGKACYDDDRFVQNLLALWLCYR